MNEKKYPRVGVGAIVLDSEDRMVLQLRNKPPEKDHWSIPGGKVEFMEKVEDTIVRELKEELGIDVEVVDLLVLTNHMVPEENAHWVSPAYLVRVIGGTAKNMEPDATKQVEWFPIDNLPKNLTITTQSAVNAYFKKYSSKSTN